MRSSSGPTHARGSSSSAARAATRCAPCAWDLPKLALALRIQRATSAYLLAATTRTLWHAGARGGEFFAGYRVEPAVVLNERFGDWFEFWERKGDPVPVRLPAAFATQLVASEPFTVSGGEAYELRLSRVTLAGAGDYLWPPFATREDRTAHP